MLLEYYRKSSENGEKIEKKKDHTSPSSREEISQKASRIHLSFLFSESIKGSYLHIYNKAGH